MELKYVPLERNTLPYSGVFSLSHLTAAVVIEVKPPNKRVEDSVKLSTTAKLDGMEQSFSYTIKPLQLRA